MTQHVAIIGLGLIGGSLSLALKRRPDVVITGFDRSYKAADEAYRRGIIDAVAPSAAAAAREADFVIFAVPVAAAVSLLREAPEWGMKESVIVTDTGSTKQPIMQAAAPLLEKGVTFIGGHPMAGSHKSGISAAIGHLFENAYYILTPPPGCSREELDKLETLLGVAQAKLAVLDAEEHDSMTAVVSHFPHIIASSLVNLLADEEERRPFIRRLAAGGFRDLTRIASADPVMWRDITMQNKDELTAQLDRWTAEMQRVRNLLQDSDPAAVEQFFDQAKQFRDQLPTVSRDTAQGALYMPFDLHIDVPDHPGVISEITRILAAHEISLTNIRIVETRTDVYGILVVSFRSANERDTAAHVLGRETDYSMQIL
ncbi:prephenate dehydrogenase [Sporosarcina sp. NCCP-2716]|uniref:prephenate dehydrogenase n=1 Tax=Sporosarcina sp. NCCP-2716 TaxID=2943679 RepID=UPI0020417F07|nr:prephenate dehydrogenase [Sporosarcina sp. NCCP-2716]GKV67954.1 prephenate dehydrogenase [Sporosarcina sp. NCCP-2716]